MKKPLKFERHIQSNERDEFIKCIKNEVNNEIFELFENASHQGFPFYFFPIANARHFFFHLTQRLIEHRSAWPSKDPFIESFSSEVKRYYGGDEWVYSTVESARKILSLNQDEVDRYYEKLDKANENLKAVRG